MNPYYEKSGITIYCGRSEDILPYISGNAIITDPPYGLGQVSGTTSIKRGKNLYKSNHFDDTEDYLINTVIPTLMKYIEKCGGRGLVTPGAKCMYLYPRPSVVGGFYQPAACGMNPWGFASFNPVLFYGKDPNAGICITPTMTSLSAPPSDDRHPCAKPYRAMLWMVEKGSLPGETIIDPFMGVGTTLLAAKNLGRKSVGVEVEEKYCEIAAQRLSQEVFDFNEILA